MLERCGDQDEDLLRVRLSLLNPSLEVIEPDIEASRPVNLHKPDYDI